MISKDQTTLVEGAGSKKDIQSRCDELRKAATEGGVIDPTKVARAALQYAASVASLLLTTEAL